MRRILVLGAGFAGLWAAIGAARKLDELGVPQGEVEILVVDRNPYHNIRVRNYEVDLDDVALPLASLLDPVGIRHMTAEVCAIDPVKQQVTLAASQDSNGGREILSYDRLVLTLGSQLARPPIEGLSTFGFDVDTYAAAVRLNDHLAALGRLEPSPQRATVVVVGAGFTGIEVAAEMPAKLAKANIAAPRVILVDPNSTLGAAIGEAGRPVVDEALTALGIETRLAVKASAVNGDGITLSSGRVHSGANRGVVWRHESKSAGRCAGWGARPLWPARRRPLHARERGQER
ncbi:MAG TPA: FAD-dependent oxidoreductase, partial [Bradyrhizobium sp.]|uniref:NAD(P)/FAD-dependent oxidoreductase n=1 Tax=Bradyrhizobium sp. TaxID=376 RepID=UPI002D7FADB5